VSFSTGWASPKKIARKRLGNNMAIKSDSPLGKRIMARPEVVPQMKPRVAKNKYHAVPTADAQGRVHPSKLQARVTDRLRVAYRAVIPEVSIPLSERPDDRIRIDALVIERVIDDGFFIGRFIEIKGKDLPAGIQKRRRFEDLYGLKIEVIRK
jgi:hypothetical protein